jgi:hypothetical protein
MKSTQQQMQPWMLCVLASELVQSLHSCRYPTAEAMASGYGLHGFEGRCEIGRASELLLYRNDRVKIGTR